MKIEVREKKLFFLVRYFKKTSDDVHYNNITNNKLWHDELRDDFLKRINGLISDSEKCKREVPGGLHVCDICSKFNNGNVEYIIDGKYRVGFGFIHFVSRHNGLPTLRFYTRILYLTRDVRPLEDVHHKFLQIYKKQNGGS